MPTAVRTGSNQRPIFTVTRSAIREATSGIKTTVIGSRSQTSRVDRRSDGRKAAGAFAEREALQLQRQPPVPRTAKCPRAAKASGALGSVGGGFGGGMQAVLRDFVDAAGGRFNALPVKVIE